ncbi:MAG: glycosyltransferase family 2 protein [Flavobacteriaceae bacterium]|nr:glycosyltransferase family 2 protein [Flavobacteriaceae bacterium]
MKLSIVILNYNVRYFLEQCIISVERAIKGINAEIIIVDNNSSDDSCDMVKEKFPHLQLIQNSENVGFSKANNQAVALAKGEYVCILNPDTAVAEDTFVAALKFAESKINLGAMGIHMMDGTGNFLPESKRNLPTPKRSLLKMMGFTKGKNGYYARNLNEEDEGVVEILAGAFMLLKRDRYKQVDGFDEDYFMYGEDIDLSYKLMKSDFQNYYAGQLSMLHYKGESTKKDADFLKRFYGAMKIFYRKHFNKNVILNFAVSLGVVFAKLLRKFKEQNYGGTRFHTDEVLVITEDFSMLKRISKVFDISVRTLRKSHLEEEEFDNKMFIFDVNYISYRQIFAVMKLLKNRGNTFRIIPPGCAFMLGSDHSDQKGEVTPL